MTEIQVKNSDSNDSTGSWTLLDDNSESEDQSSIQGNEVIEIESEIDLKENEKEEKCSNESFLVFDEYLQERLLEQSEKPQKNKKSLKAKIMKGEKKCKAQNLGIPVFITILLALSAFATLCSTLSQPYIEKDQESTTKILMRPKQTEEIKQTLKEIDKPKDAKLLGDMEKLKKQCPKNAAPFPQLMLEEIKEGFKILDEIEDIFKNTTEQKLRKTTPKLKKLDEFQPKSKILKNEQSKPPKITRSSWMLLKHLLLDTNVHALFSLIMTNIYLFTLLADFTRRSDNYSFKSKFKKELLQDLRRHKSPEKIKRRLFKELPFHNVQLVKKSEKKKKVKTTNKAKITPKTPIKMAIVNENKKTENILFNSCPVLAKNPSIFPLVVVPSEETGKSECQRRFEELDMFDKKCEDLKQSQRNRIKLLKQKFKNEVTHIRDTEEESEVRAEKINKTSQRFIKKLKCNREKYLLEMRKIRELRQKVSDGKKGNVKDVASGSYSVSLSPIYDYGEKFKIIKEKFERENNQLPREWKFQ